MSYDKVGRYRTFKGIWVSEFVPFLAINLSELTNHLYFLIWKCYFAPAFKWRLSASDSHCSKQTKQNKQLSLDLDHVPIFLLTFLFPSFTLQLLIPTLVYPSCTAPFNSISLMCNLRLYQSILIQKRFTSKMKCGHNFWSNWYEKADLIGKEIRGISLLGKQSNYTFNCSSLRIQHRT